MSALELVEDERNPTYIDWWSLTHLAWGVLLALLLEPFFALAALVLWEPFEVLVLSRVMAMLGMRFGHETLQNSLVDLVFDAVGVLVGVFFAKPLVALLLS